MPERCSANEKKICRAVPGICKKGLDETDHPVAALALLNTQQDQAEAGDDDEQAEFEVLATLQEFVPRPEALGEGHGDDFNSHDKQEDAA